MNLPGDRDCTRSHQTCFCGSSAKSRRAVSSQDLLGDIQASRPDRARAATSHLVLSETRVISSIDPTPLLQESGHQDSEQEYIHVNPRVSVVYAYRGVTLASLCGADDVLSAVDFALDPRDLTALNNKGLLLSGLGPDEEAMVVLVMARELARYQAITLRVW